MACTIPFLAQSDELSLRLSRWIITTVHCIAGLLLVTVATAQGVPITDYQITELGQAELTIDAQSGSYYVLWVRIADTEPYRYPMSMKLGVDGELTLTEPLSAYPESHYEVRQYSRSAPADVDGDGVDDLTEYNGGGPLAVFNAAEVIDPSDGYIELETFENFKELAITRDRVQWSEFLNGKGFTKFLIIDVDTDHPKIYFLQGSKHALHRDFAEAIGIEHIEDHQSKGQVIYHPEVISANGTAGAFTFTFSNGHGRSFDDVQRTYQLLAANMPFTDNNLSYYITDNNDDEYERDRSLYDASRITVLFESVVDAELVYLALNQSESYGLLRVMDLDEVPGQKEIVIYDALPSSLPRVGGIITSYIQAPLSHVNLRAIQDAVPNAYIKEPLEVDSIVALVGKYVYLRVDADGYYIREAQLAEVNDWYKDLRPTETQIPPLNLDYKDILPLTEIEFGMADGFGAKATNVAVLLSLGFPDGTTPEGFGVPFYFYREFMEYNGFFDQAREMIADPDFLVDREYRSDLLKDFRDDIEEADMPQWMLDELEHMHRTWPTSQSIRCRSSTNNEDLPGFNGAGLYTSKTQKPSEGHIKKSIREIYASLWNLRAFDEREFYRVDHMLASMGVLCHPNYKDEKVNGVGVTSDPIYQTDETFYLNSQLGEELITDPSATAIPEEILLDRVSISGSDFVILQYSNLASRDSLLMGEEYLDDLRDYMVRIHDEFEILYEAQGEESFAMDIEYKITAEDQLIIKQARPWASYMPTIIDTSVLAGRSQLLFPNPTLDRITMRCVDCDYQELYVTTASGQVVLQKLYDLEQIGPRDYDLPVNDLSAGVYFLSGIDTDGRILFLGRFMKL